MLPEDHPIMIAKADYGEGAATILCRTRLGQYFSTVRTVFGGTENIHVLNRERAMEAYHKLPIHLISFEDAFPEGKIEAVG